MEPTSILLGLLAGRARLVGPIAVGMAIWVGIETHLSAGGFVAALLVAAVNAAVGVGVRRGVVGGVRYLRTRRRAPSLTS